MRKFTRSAARGGAIAVGAALLLVGCAAAPEAPSGSEPAAEEPTVDIQPCIVSDEGGFDDRSFNQLGAEGLRAAAETLGVEPMEVESASPSDYAPNLDSVIAQGCNMVVSVGFSLAEATGAAAEANPDVNFAIIDDNSITADNVQPIVYNTAEAAFLAGYAAASYTETGVIATWGGIQIPPVTIFMDGFVEGAEYYNEQNGEDVQILGWDAEAQSGSFTGGFAAGVEAKAMAQTYIDQNADVLMPVGGPIFLSAVEAIRDAGDDSGISMVGVDADLVETSPENADIFLTSVLKGMSTGVQTVVEQAAAGEFSNEPYVGTLENEGVGLAPFHEFEDAVDPELQAQLDEIEAAIIAGEITVESPASP
ncbi:BMP family ABC transporter substrate-binding protein [Agrococcus baldri]|uniref:BMP family ABC transporter substrate-binding protein n=1 Tax=Agrococcus baldri TaxID=153730 RepID=A0AA87RDI5_9MICO|nr:BMP family ABC transporter substrate-binding protein [Agrococcus baldri]GEK80707.1 BMP family ABC transporter substrate-binding protein [Agrococcus baldri]